MFDLTSLWKKIILKGIDEAAMRVDPVPQDSTAYTVPLIRPSSDTIDAESENDREAVLAYRNDYRENIHRRSPSPNKPFFG